eukprot:UN06765
MSEMSSISSIRTASVYRDSEYEKQSSVDVFSQLSLNNTNT